MTTLALCSLLLAGAPGFEEKPHSTPTQVVLNAPAYEGVLIDTNGDGPVWAVGQTWKASFGPEGASFHPFLGPDAPRAESARFDLSGASVDGVALAVDPPVVTQADTAAVTLSHGAALARYLLRPGEVEQTFVFDSLPRRGALELRLALESTMEAHPVEGGGLDLYGPEGLAMTYGRAIAYDASGTRTAVAMERTAEGLTLRVPEGFVSGATLPLTIDPVLATAPLADESYAEYEPDVAYFQEFDRWVVSYHRHFNLTDTDVYVRSVTAGGIVSVPIIVDASTDYWSHARLAALRGSGAGLVVASVVPNDPTTEDGVIRGRRIVIPFLTPGAAFDISEPTTGSQIDPVIAAPKSGAAFHDYLVTWVREFAPNDGDIHARLVSGLGMPVGSTIVIENLGSDDDRRVAISPSEGAAGSQYLLAWERGGDVWAKRITTDGNIAFRPSYPVLFGAERPSVTSFLNRTIGGQWIAVIAAQALIQPPFQPAHTDIVMVAVDAGDGVGERHDLTSMEASATREFQSEPSVVADDTGFLLGYRESYAPGDRDIYMLSGSVTVSPTGAEPALAERHQALYLGTSDESRPAFASRWDGGGSPLASLGAFQDGDDVFSSDVFFSRLTRGYDPATPPIGVQSDDCSPEPNSTGKTGWMVLTGTQSTTGQKGLFCIDVPINTFGLFVTSMTTGYQTNVGGGEGTLCLGGGIGRFNVIVLSGPEGVLQQQLSMSALQTPNGLVPTLPGERWHFQAWHRDVVGGVATSNFSGAMSIVFD